VSGIVSMAKGLCVESHGEELHPAEAPSIGSEDGARAQLFQMTLSVTI
jgi:hypothetical protein